VEKHGRRKAHILPVAGTDHSVSARSNADSPQ